MRHSEKEGLLFAMAGFSSFSVGETIIKTIGGDWPSLAVAALRLLIAAIAMGAILYLREGRSAFAMPRPAVQIMRGLGLGLGTAATFSALFLMPLAEATAIFFVSPMITALLATLLLGEPARRSVWFALLLAFAGVLLIIRPNFAQYGWAVLLPLAAALGASTLVLGNRVVAGLASGLAMQFYSAALAAILLTLLAMGLGLSGVEGMALSWPDWTVIARITIVAFTATCGHWLLYIATTRAGAATIAPMTYVQMLVALSAGFLVFGDWPDLPSMGGAAMIVGAGIWLWRAGRPHALAETDVP